MGQKNCGTGTRAGRSLTVLVSVLVATLFGLRLLAGVASLAFESSLPLIGGHGLAIVTSGSMEPAISRGDVVITREVADRIATPSSLNEIKVDDVISYSGEGNNDLSITHRVVARTVTPDQVFFATKGDAVVGAVPSEVSGSRVDGKVIAVVPYLGMVLIALGSRLLIAGAVVLLLTVLFARGWSTPTRRPRTGNSSQSGEELQQKGINS